MSVNHTPVMRAVASAESWHAIQLALPHPHPLQSWTWGAFKSRWGWTMHPVVWETGNRPVASALILKRRLPRTPYCLLYIPKGPNFEYADATLRAQVLDQLQQWAREQGALGLTIDPDVVEAWGEEPQPNADGGAFVADLVQRGWHFGAQQVQFRNTCTLDLTPSEDDLLAAFKSKTRYNIRLAGRKGIVVQPGSAETLPTLVEMYMGTAARNKFAVRPKRYYLDLWHSMIDAGMAQPLIARYEGTPVAAVILVAYGELALYMVGASTHIERRRMPNHLLQWEAIRWAKARGCTTYDFWGAPDEFVETDSMWGVWRFKRGFNPVVRRHIGAWDYPVRPILYRLYTEAAPRYLNLLRARNSEEPA